QSFELTRLERQVKLDDEAYQSYMRTAEQSRLTNALEQSKLLRLSVVEPADLPMEPVSPRQGQLPGLGLVGGLVFGLAAGFARDYMNTTVKTAADVRRYANLDVLTVLPERA